MRHLSAARTFRTSMIVVMVVAGGATLDACGGPGDPTVIQAETALKADINEMAKTVRAEDLQVIDAGGRNIPCGEGRAKRTYEISGAKAWGSDKLIDVLSVLTLSLREKGYTSARIDPSTAKENLVSQTARTTIVAMTFPGRRFKVAGETDCLGLE